MSNDTKTMSVAWYAETCHGIWIEADRRESIGIKLEALGSALQNDSLAVAWEPVSESFRQALITNATRRPDCQ